MILSIFAFLLVFTTVVLVHELGHYLAARRAGVKVYEFSIGFPFSPRIATLFTHRETAFTLRLLPLGGFVSFSKDENDAAADLFNIPRTDRALIMAAGAFFNILFAFIVLVPVFSIGRHLPLIESVELAAKTIWSTISGSILLLAGIFEGKGSMESLIGPVGIALFAGKAAAKGLLNLLYFSGMLSLSLGIMNLIPFPALDGGQLFMLMIEAMKRKPLSVRIYQIANAVGMALFLILAVIITYRDIVRLLSKTALS